MFAKMTERYGVPDYAPRALDPRAGQAVQDVGYGPAMFAGTLFVEEILDQLQRESMRDESVQPLTRMVNRIHVTEEARHVRYAREELHPDHAEDQPRRSAPSRAGSRRASRTSSPATSSTPTSTRSVGIDPAVGRKAALANPHWQETLRWSARKLVPFLREQGIIGGRPRSSGGRRT